MKTAEDLVGITTILVRVCSALAVQTRSQQVLAQLDMAASKLDTLEQLPRELQILKEDVQNLVLWKMDFPSNFGSKDEGSPRRASSLKSSPRRSKSAVFGTESRRVSLFKT